MAFTDEQVEQVWQKGNIAQGNDPKIYRKDQCGAWIARSQYGNRNSEYGWEIDHISPQSNGGNDNLSNLRPLQWQNNLDKSNGRLSCPIKASGVHNIKG